MSTAENKPAASGKSTAAAGAKSTAPSRRRLVGRVASNKMNKTIVVEVLRFKLDPVYKKYIRVRKKYKAHDEKNECNIGDRVEIIEHAPISKDKRWKLSRLIDRAQQENVA